MHSELPGMAQKRKAIAEDCLCKDIKLVHIKIESQVTILQRLPNDVLRAV